MNKSVSQYNKKILLLIGILLLLVYVRFVIMPLNNDITSTRAGIESRRQEIDKIKKTISSNTEIEMLINDLLEKYKPFPSGVSVIGYIETQLNQAGLKRKIVKLNQRDAKNINGYSINSVSLQLNGLELAELTELLSLFDNSGYAINFDKADISKDVQNKFGIILEINCLTVK